MKAERPNRLRYKDQSADALCLHVATDRLDANRFLPLATARLDHDEFHVQAGIIGTSHIVQVSVERPGMAVEQVTEVLACGSLPDGVRPMFSGRLTEISYPVEILLVPRLHYWFTASRTDHISGLPRFLALAERAAEYVGEDIPGHSAETREDVRQTAGLVYSFPESLPGTYSERVREGCWNATPQTAVLAALGPRERCVTVATAHSYPNEDTLVFSESRVSFGEPRTERRPG